MSCQYVPVLDGSVFSFSQDSSCSGRRDPAAAWTHQAALSGNPVQVQAKAGERREAEGSNVAQLAALFPRVATSASKAAACFHIASAYHTYDMR